MLIAQLLIIDNRGILNKKNLLEMAKNVAQKIREPANNIMYIKFYTKFLYSIQLVMI